jgi:hypothetical protein
VEFAAKRKSLLRQNLALQQSIKNVENVNKMLDSVNRTIINYTLQ